MRGQRVREPARRAKIDLLIVAARYREDRLELAKGYQPRGQVWSDVLLFDREELVERLKSGARIGYGRHAPSEDEFTVEGNLRLEEREGETLILSDGSPTSTDDLNVPVF